MRVSLARVDSHASLTPNPFQRSKAEESLTSELQELRDQVNLKRTSMNEHVSHLDMLREEVSSLSLSAWERL